MKNSLLLFLISILSIASSQIGLSQLPTEISSNLSELETDNLLIASNFAPTVHQMTDMGLTHSVGGLGDLITSVLYDNGGTPNTTDNWESLKNFANADPLIHDNPIIHDELDPIVYYSVVWTTKYWFITYAFYHPRDYAGSNNPCCEGIGNLPGDNHENDLEGAIVVVTRDDSKVQGVATISHSDLLVYDLAPSSSTPDLMIDNGTHAVEVKSSDFQSIQSFGNICDNGVEFYNPHIIYTLATDQNNPFVTAVPNSGFLDGNGGYKLEDIFGSDPNSLFNLKYHTDVFAGSNIFRRDGFTECQQYGGDASAPWGWSQMKYDWSDLNSLLFQLSLGSGSANLKFLHNPYFNECGEGVTYEVGQIPGEEISYVQLYSEFVIPANQTLTIKDKELRMDAGGRIILHEGSTLILDNTKISNCTGTTVPSELWDGIFALDSGAETLIRIENGSTIEKSKFGVTNTDEFGSINWQAGYVSYNGGNLDIYIEDSFFSDNENCITMADGPMSNSGYVYVDNTVFEENFNGIGFFGKDEGSLVVKFSEFYDTDRVISVTSSKVPVSINDNKIFDTQLTAIEFDRSRNIKFERNLLEGGIGLALANKDSYAKIIDDNHFDNNYQAIYSSGTFPNAAGVQIGNSLTDANLIENSTAIGFAALRADGNTYPTGAEIVNNLIRNSAFSGINLKGVNNSNVINNTIINSVTGFLASTTGPGENIFNCNKFINNDDQDMQINGLNSKSKFLGNLFTGLPTYVSPNINLVSATVHPFQGNAAKPANNCFMDNVEADLNVIGDPTLPGFTYTYYESATIDNCEIPLTEGNYIPDPSTDEGESNCPQGVGSNFTSSGFDPEAFVTLDYEQYEYCQCFQDSIDYYTALVVAGGGDDPGTEQDESTSQTESLLEDEMHLNFWIRAALFYAINNEEYAYGINILQPLLKWKWQASLYGIYILSSQYTLAETHLQGLSENTLDQKYFKDIQRINIRRWSPSVLPYQASKEELDILYSIAIGESPSSGYASSLYYAFTGDVVPISISVPLKNQKRSSNQNDKIVNWIYPNPSHGVFEIDKTLIQHIKSFKLYNSTGQLVFSKDQMIGFSGRLDLSFLRLGVYFLEVKLINNSTKKTKLVII